MNATIWLLIAIGSTLALALAIAYFVARHHEAKRALEYRTADGGVIEADVQALQQLVPDAKVGIEWRRITKELENFGLLDQADKTSLLKYCETAASMTPPRPRVRAGTYNLAQVAAQAVTAALRDMGSHKQSPNPHPGDTVEHTHWAHHYQRVRASATAADRESQQAQIEAQSTALPLQ